MVLNLSAARTNQRCWKNQPAAGASKARTTTGWPEQFSLSSCGGIHVGVAHNSKNGGASSQSTHDLELMH